MEITEFAQKAIRTEGRIEQVRTNRQLLKNAVVIFIKAAYILDVLKKNIFYGKPVDSSAIINTLDAMRGALTHDVDNITSIKLDESIQHDVIEIDPRLFHSIIGIATEAAELLEAIYPALEGGRVMNHEVDRVNILEEFGDINWYQAVGIDTLNGDWNQILETIIKKLEARYGDKFNREGAVNRNLNKERQILNKMES